MFAGAAFAGSAAPHSSYPPGYTVDQALGLKRIRLEEARLQVEREREDLTEDQKRRTATEERNRFDERAHWQSEIQLLAEYARKLSARPAPGPTVPPRGIPQSSTIARNLEAFRQSAKLSYRGLATLIGCDHKAVTKHCRGERIPRDRFLSEYASAFTRNLQRDVTVEELRGVGKNHN